MPRWVSLREELLNKEHPDTPLLNMLLAFHAMDLNGVRLESFPKYPPKPKEFSGDIEFTIEVDE